MRTTQHNFVAAMAMVAASVFFLSSCGGGDDDPKPTAGFSYSAEGRVVTFTSTSTNATGFSWDFGDGETSTEQNPVHTYEAYGKYTVSLKVTGKGGSATSLPDELTLAKTSGVVIDGNFGDWADVPVSTSLGAGTISKVKVDYDALNIYFYVEGTADLRGFFDLYLNTDNDYETAFSTAHWPLGLGSEVLIEGDFPSDGGTMYGYDFSHGDNTVFDFNIDTPLFAAGTGFLTSSAVKDISGGKAIEFSISRSSLAGLSAEGFSYGLEDVSESWSKIGSAPSSETAESESQFVNLTQ